MFLQSKKLIMTKDRNTAVKNDFPLLFSRRGQGWFLSHNQNMHGYARLCIKNN